MTPPALNTTMPVRTSMHARDRSGNSAMPVLLRPWYPPSVFHGVHSRAFLRHKSVRGLRLKMSTQQISARAEINDAHRDATVTCATRAPDRRCSHLRRCAACTDFHLKLECGKVLVTLISSGTAAAAAASVCTTAPSGQGFAAMGTKRTTHLQWRAKHQSASAVAREAPICSARLTVTRLNMTKQERYPICSGTRSTNLQWSDTVLGT